MAMPASSSARAHPIFPRGIGEMLCIVRNNEARLNYNRRFLPKIAGWLMKLRRASGARHSRPIAEAMNLILSHAALSTGRSPAEPRRRVLPRHRPAAKGYRSRELRGGETRVHLALADLFTASATSCRTATRSPISSRTSRRVLPAPCSGPIRCRFPNPAASPARSARLFEQMGGTFADGDARSARPRERSLLGRRPLSAWPGDGAGRHRRASGAVVDGPARPARLPLSFAVKRGYHRHSAARRCARSTGRWSMSTMCYERRRVQEG